MFLQKTIEFNRINDFIVFWRPYFSVKRDWMYHENINRKVFRTENLLTLFEWKNGSNLSEDKRESFQRIAQDLPTINRLRKKFDANIFDDCFGHITAIWQIFLLHIINPTDYPIFDQHVYRAYQCLNGREIIEMANNEVKLNAYFREYRPFFQRWEKRTRTHSAKEIDEALWAFGKFIKEYPNLLS